MSPTETQSHNRPGGRRTLLIVAVILLVGGAAAALAVRRKTPRGPELLNQPTKAREVRPFTSKTDPRFDPLPYEPEKHGK